MADSTSASRRSGSSSRRRIIGRWGIVLAIGASTLGISVPAHGLGSCGDIGPSKGAPSGPLLLPGTTEEFSIIDGEPAESGHLPGISAVQQFQLDIPLSDLAETGLPDGCDPFAGSMSSLQPDYAGTWPTTYVTIVEFGAAISTVGFTEVLLLQEIPGTDAFGQRPIAPFAPDQDATWAAGPVWTGVDKRLFHALGGSGEFQVPIPIDIASNENSTRVAWFTPTMSPWRIVVDGSATLDPADPSSIETVTARSTPLFEPSTEILTADELVALFVPASSDVPVPEVPDPGVADSDLPVPAEDPPQIESADDPTGNVTPPVVVGDLPEDDPDSGFEWIYVAVPIVVAGVTVMWAVVASRRARKRYAFVRSTRIWTPSEVEDPVNQPAQAIAFADGLARRLEASGATLNERGRYVFDRGDVLGEADGLEQHVLGDDLVRLFARMGLREERDPDRGCFPAMPVLDWFYGGPRDGFELDPATHEVFATERETEPGETVNMDESVVIS